MPERSGNQNGKTHEILLHIAKWYGVSIETLNNINNGDTWKDDNEQSFRLGVQKEDLPQLAQNIYYLERSIDYVVTDAIDPDSDEDYLTVTPKIKLLGAKKEIVVERFCELLNIDTDDTKKLKTKLLKYYNQSKKIDKLAKMSSLN